MAKSLFSRRQFLRIIGISGAAGLALKLGTDLSAQRQIVSETRVLMGTVVNLTLVTDDAQAGNRALTACLDHMASLEAVLSRFRPDSQLTRLNETGTVHAPDPHLVSVLRQAHQLSDLTGGAFDVTIKPLVDLYQAAVHRDASLPAPAAIEQALNSVGYHNLQVSADAVSFAQSGMGITLDGIAKGYIVDEGTAVLRQSGFENVLVEAGGDLAAAGDNAGSTPWRIGIQAPRPGEQRYLKALPVTNRAVATSGDYMQPFSRDFEEHHILNPFTGHSSPQLASATVVAPTCVLADGLATAMMVLPPEQSMAMLRMLPDCDAYLVGKDLRVWQSAGFQNA